ncbi:MAG: arginine--tRNA ligase, partial [Bacteroidales bacterium]|jgi:arginyl-tRNA synthetase|nr:arginine--tRNA ligase [Bacteroidales bacterium]
MKSREGTVVDDDDLIAEMTRTAEEIASETGKLNDCSPDEIRQITEIVAMGALKYFILKVDPRKNMVFNPKESIDFNGNTGPFIQYTHARIRSVLRKAAERQIVLPPDVPNGMLPNEKEQSLIRNLSEFPVIVQEASDTCSPAVIANYTYELVKEYNQFYHDCSILGEENHERKLFRLILSQCVANVVKTGMKLLGIDVPERM